MTVERLQALVLAIKANVSTTTEVHACADPPPLYTTVSQQIRRVNVIKYTRQDISTIFECNMMSIDVIQHYRAASSANDVIALH